MLKSLRFAALLVGVALVSRLIPHWPNFTAIVALGLFSGLAFGRKWTGSMLVLVTLLVSDLIINYSLGYPGISASYLWNYLPLMAMPFLAGQLSKNPSFGNLLGGSVAGSLLFFFVSNLGVWFSGTYGLTLPGLAMCYTAGLPFLGSLFAGTVVYGLIFLGAYRVLYHQKTFLPAFIGR